MDIFDTKDIAPMLIAENKPPFDDANCIYELKLDGVRCLAYLDGQTGQTDLRNKRNKCVSGIYPELSKIYNQVKTRCILDGELVVIKDGKPDFYEIQRRSLMTHPVRIDLASQKLPVSFTAFDILYHGDRQITELPVTERKRILFDTVEETPRLALSRHIEEKGTDFYNLALQQGLQGVVAKRKDSKYYFGKRTSDWVKIKVMLDDDFVICGYFPQSDSITSLILGGFVNEKLTYQSRVTMGSSRLDFKIITKSERTDKSFYAGFPDFEGAVWLEPKLVCMVEFMARTPGGGFRQPVYRGIRDDKLPEECVIGDV